MTDENVAEGGGGSQPAVKPGGLFCTWTNSNFNVFI